MNVLAARASIRKFLSKHCRVVKILNKIKSTVLFNFETPPR